MKEFISALAVILLLLAVDWGITVGLLWLIAFYFKNSFSLAYATLIWLVSLLIYQIYCGLRHKK